MATIENFLLRFRVEGQRALDATRNSVNALRDDIEGFAQVGGPLGGTINGIIGKLGPLGLVAGVAGGAFVALGLRAAAMADEIQDMADATGIGAGQLLNLKTSLAQAGGDASSFVGIANRLNLAIGESMGGNDKFQKSFKDLGIIIRDSNGNLRDAGDILQDTLASLANISDPAVRAAKAVELLGKEASKINWSNVSAGKDAISDEQIKKLAEYRGALDDLAATIDEKIILAFGRLNDAITKPNWQEEARKVAAYILPFGRMVDLMLQARGIIPIPDDGSFDRAEAARLSRAGKPATAPGGDQGGPTQAAIKAAQESQKRIEQGRNDVARQLRLRGANEIQAIEINSQSEIFAKAIEIKARENLTDKQKSSEIAVMRRQIELKAAADIAKIRMDASAKAYAEEEKQREDAAKAIADQESAYQKGAESARQQAENFALATQEAQKRIDLEGELANMSKIDADAKRQIYDLEQQRTQQLKQLEQTQNLAYADRVVSEKEINAATAEGIARIRERAEELKKSRADFVGGWKAAFAEYADDAKNAADQASQVFQTFTQGFEDAFVNFVKTGKLSFKDLANSVIADLARIQARRLLVNLISSGGGLFGRAGGGNVNALQPYMVGENGPEMFIPNAAGSIKPNYALGGGGMAAVTYNINAVDASSFRQLVASDPSFIYAVTEQGRRSLPQTRR
jgi:lambda family phage tail tape measure protein